MTLYRYSVGIAKSRLGTRNFGHFKLRAGKLLQAKCTCRIIRGSCLNFKFPKRGLPREKLSLLSDPISGLETYASCKFLCAGCECI